MRIDAAIEKFMDLWDDFSRGAKTDHEVSCLLNMAQFALMKERTAPLRHKPSNSNQYHMDNFHRLLESYKGEVITTDDSGCISYEKLRANFPQDKVYDDCGNLVDDKKPDILHIAYLKRWSGSKYRKVKWVSLNDYAMHCENCFLEPTDDYPIYVQHEDYLQLKPEGSRLLEIAVFRNPVHMWSVEGTKVDPELPDHIMYQVIMKAVELAGIQSRDTGLFQMAQQEDTKL